MRQLDASKVVVMFLASPITPVKLVRIFCHLHLIYVGHFYLTQIRLVLSNENNFQ